jgi:hypothetical protein
MILSVEFFFGLLISALDWILNITSVLDLLTYTLGSLFLSLMDNSSSNICLFTYLNAFIF